MRAHHIAEFIRTRLTPEQLADVAAQRVLVGDLLALPGWWDEAEVIEAVELLSAKPPATDEEWLKAACEHDITYGEDPTPPGSHTPGPWSVSDGLVRLEDQIDQLLRDIGSDKEWVPVVIHDREGECGVTALCHPVNARLIAAAPELLELAQFMVLNIGGYDSEKARDMARAAIAKATGH